MVTQNTNATTLTNALVGGAGLTVTSLTLAGRSGGAASSGLYTLNGNGVTPYGLTSGGVVLSTGNVSAYAPGPNTGTGSTAYGTGATAAQTLMLAQVGGAGGYFDVTQLTINFTLSAASDRIFFDVVFGSEEYPTYANSNFVDGFGLFVYGTNVATVGGAPVNINNPAFVTVTARN